MSAEFRMDIQIQGLDGLRQRVRKQAGGALAKGIQATFERIGATVEREAKIRAPHPPGLKGYSRGTLRRSLGWKPLRPVGVRIGPTVFYGAFVEFGTGRRGAASGVKPFAGYHYGPRAGMSAQPYLVPALEAKRREIDGLLREYGGRVVKNLAGKA